MMGKYIGMVLIGNIGLLAPSNIGIYIGLKIISLSLLEVMAQNMIG